DAHHGLVFAAVSPSHQRLVYGAQSSAGGATALTVLAPGARVYDVALAPGATAWLFAQTGDALGGPLVFFDGADAPAHAAPPETRWPGDERLRVALLRARAARAAYTDVEGTFLALSARPDAASNPHLPGLS